QFEAHSETPRNGTLSNDGRSAERSAGLRARVRMHVRQRRHLPKPELRKLWSGLSMVPAPRLRAPRRLMSALGHKVTQRHHEAMSALPLKADKQQACW